MLSFIDTHTHLLDEKMPDIDMLREHWKCNHISNVFVVSFDKKSIYDYNKLAIDNKDIYCILGVHPEEVKDYTPDLEKELLEICQGEKVLAIGEIGLDYHYIDSSDEASKAKQKEVFVSQIILADKLNLPIVIHLRDACQDMLNILKENKHYLNNGGVIHCFSESVESFREFKKLGFAISVGGVVTFKNGKKLQEVIKEAELTDILLETDCPYLTPEPYRGQVNEPKNVYYIAEKICELKNISMEELSDATNKNIKRIFKKFRG